MIKRDSMDSGCSGYGCYSCVVITVPSQKCIKIHEKEKKGSENLHYSIFFYNFANELLTQKSK